MVEPLPKKRSVVILAAEEDPDDRLALKEAFSQVLECEIQLHFVKDGEELMEALTRRWTPSVPGRPPLPRLILLDLGVQGKDGREALRGIKSNPGVRQIPVVVWVVVWTTSAVREEIDQYYELGASSCLPRPSGYTQLVETLGIFCRYWFRQVSLPQERT